MLRTAFDHGFTFERTPQNSVPATGVRINPICRRLLPGSALGAKFEVVVGVVSAVEVTLRHHRAAFHAKMFVSHRVLFRIDSDCKSRRCQFDKLQAGNLVSSRDEIWANPI